MPIPFFGRRKANNVFLSPHNQKTLMIAANDQVNENAEYTANAIADGSIVDKVVYPPNHEFSSDEKEALAQLRQIPHLKSALQKVLADSTAGAFFNFFNFLDGTGDPKEKHGKWTWATIVDHPQDGNDPYIQMLHDSFYDAYWDWKKIERK